MAAECSSLWHTVMKFMLYEPGRPLTRYTHLFSGRGEIVHARCALCNADDLGHHVAYLLRVTEALERRNGHVGEEKAKIFTDDLYGSHRVDGSSGTDGAVSCGALHPFIKRGDVLRYVRRE